MIVTYQLSISTVESRINCQVLTDGHTSLLAAENEIRVMLGHAATAATAAAVAAVAAGWMRSGNSVVLFRPMMVQ